MMLKSPRLFLLPLVLLTLFSIWYTNLHNRLSTFKTQPFGAKDSLSATQTSTSKGLHHIQNSTLGFERVFLLNLPERTDKFDAFALSSSLHSFTFDVVNGVHGALILNKTLPTLDGLPVKERARNNVLGAWRAHLNVAQRMVHERISTAIVFEDDSDWDIDLRTQLEQFAQGSRYITSSWSESKDLKGKANGGDANSPYGEDWDMLWLGHCGVNTHPSDPRQFRISNDPTVPSPKRRVNYQNVPDLSGHSNSTRIVLRIGSGVCLFSYALSYRGAQKLLLAQSTLTKFQPIDIGFRVMCGEEDGFKCVGAFPQIIDTHKPAGSIDRDSDITEFDKSKHRAKGYTNNVVRSTKLNWRPLLAGSMDQIEVQFPEDTPEVVGDVMMTPE